MPVKYSNKKKKKGDRKSFFGDNAGAVASITQNPEDPNTNCSENVYDIEKLEYKKSKIGLCVDVSGSNNCKEGAEMLTQIHDCTSIDDDCYDDDDAHPVLIQPFGKPGPITDSYTEIQAISVGGTWTSLYKEWQTCNSLKMSGKLDRDSYLMQQYKGFREFCADYFSSAQFNTCTDTFSLNHFIRNSHKENIDTIYIIGDGEFSGRYTGAIDETKKFLSNLETCDFSKLQRLVILFCNHTSINTEQSLKRDILSMLNTTIQWCQLILLEVLVFNFVLKWIIQMRRIMLTRSTD